MTHERSPASVLLAPDEEPTFLQLDDASQQKPKSFRGAYPSIETLECLHETRSYREGYPTRVSDDQQTARWIHHNSQHAAKQVSMCRRESYPPTLPLRRKPPARRSAWGSAQSPAPKELASYSAWLALAQSEGRPTSRAERAQRVAAFLKLRDHTNASAQQHDATSASASAAPYVDQDACFFNDFADAERTTSRRRPAHRITRPSPYSRDMRDSPWQADPEARGGSAGPRTPSPPCPTNRPWEPAAWDLPNASWS